MTAPLDIQLLPDQDAPVQSASSVIARVRVTGREAVITRPAPALLTHQAAARRILPTALELGQLRAWHRDPYPARAEIDDQGGVILDADDPAEAVLIVCHLVLNGEVLGRGNERRGREGTGGQEAPGGGAGRFHHLQYAPLTLTITAAR
jgi:hypothetical protein